MKTTAQDKHDKKLHVIGGLTLLVTTIGVLASILFDIHSLSNTVETVEVKMEVPKSSPPNEISEKSLSISSSLPAKTDNVVLVTPLDFSTVAGDYPKKLLNGIARGAISQLQSIVLSSQEYKVIAKDKINLLLDEIEFSKTGVVSPQTMLESGKIESASLALLGEINELSSYTHTYTHTSYSGISTQINTRNATINLTLKLVDIESGNVLYISSPTSKSTKQQINNGENLTRKDQQLFLKAIKLIINDVKAELVQKFNKMSPEGSRDRA